MIPTGDLANAIRNLTDLKFGLYHSLMEWTHSLYIKDQDNKWSTQEFVRTKLMPDLRELVYILAICARKNRTNWLKKLVIGWDI